MGRGIVVEAGDIVPNIELGPGLMPVPQVPDKGGVGIPAAVLEGMGEAALNGAEAHRHIMPGPDSRGAAGILVGQGVKGHMGELRLQGLGYGVYEAYQRP